MIHTVTLNPALDRILFLKEFKRNVTNRVTNVKYGIGGKGTHVSMNLCLMGCENIAWGVCYGPYGEEIRKILGNFGVDERFIHKDGQNSRMNYLLIEESGDCTLVSEIGPQVLPEDFEALIIRIRENLNEGDILALSGDVTNCGADVYPRIIDAVKDKRPKIALDASGPALKECMKKAPYLVKPNLDELSTLCGRQVCSETDDIISALAALEGYGTEIFAVSMGSDGALLKTQEGIWIAKAPKVQVTNTIGCGDCFLSGLLSGFETGLGAEASLRRAIAFSAAAAEWSDSVGFDINRPGELINKVEIIYLNHH